MKRFLITTAPFLVLAAACGDQRDEPASDENESTALDASVAQADSERESQDEKAPTPTATPKEKPMFQTKPIKQDASNAPIAESCRGFELKGLKYSPGGDQGNRI